MGSEMCIRDSTNTELEVAIEDPKYEDNTDTLLEADPK